MPTHHHTALKHSRAEKRQDYARLYVAVRFLECTALCDTDNFLLAWTDWSDAQKAAGRVGMIVVNWQGFHERYLPFMAVRPPAARLIVKTHRGVKTFHAEIDASSEELSTLNQFCDWERNRAPKKVAAKERKAKVWEERA